MAMYCKYCGLPIEKCTCEGSQDNKNNNERTDSFTKEKIKENMGIPNEKGRKEAYERGKKIVPDCILPNDGEIPLRQYDIARLRTIMKGAFAEGRLQVTNKRVMFRSSGFSLLGPNKIQYEFAVNEVAGIEIRNDHRLGVFHFIAAWIACSAIITVVNDIFTKIAGFSPFLSGLCASVLFAWAVLFFFTNKQKLYIKLLFNSIAAGALAVQAVSTRLLVVPVLNGNIFSYMEGFILILIVLNSILIVYVPNLVLEIKTKGANSSIEIRRKESNGILAFLFNMPKKDYTGYADVMPGEDLEKARKELGALINDINTIGDEAIEKWREK